MDLPITKCSNAPRAVTTKSGRELHAENVAWELEVFFDGQCPLCRKEVAIVKKLDRRQRVLFTDIAAVDFNPSGLGIPFEQLMAEIHGRLPDGQWVSGVEVFRRLYTAVGFGILVRITRLPGISGVLEAVYRFFARNRLKWTGRCSATNSRCSSG